MVTDHRDVRHLDVTGPDPVEVGATDSHQDHLVPLIRRRHAEASTSLRRTVSVVPVCDADATCELHSDDGVVGVLPPELAAEVHSGLLALANLEPPYRVTLLLRLEWRERAAAPTQVHATALVDLHDLRLLAC